MEMQNVKNLDITEGTVKTIHDKNNQLLWGAVGYDTKYAGDTYQQTYSGKNLLPNNAVGTTVKNDVTFTVDSTGRITVNGTATANTYYNVPTITLSAGEYVISGLPANGSGSTFKMTFTFAGAQQNCFLAAGKSFTLSAEATATEHYLFIANGYQANNLVFEPMIEKGSTATDYEPYVGGIPSPNPDYPQDIQVVTGEQTVNVHGKNLLNPTLFDGITENSDGTLKTTKYYTVTTAVSFHLKASTRYTLSIRNSDGELTGQGWGVAVNGTWINTTSGVGSVNTDANGDVTLQIGASSYGAIGNWNSFIQLEQGSTATAYEPYQSQDYEVNLSSKNMLDMTTLVDGYVTIDGTFNASYPLGEMRSGFIKVEPNTTYTFSIIEKTLTNEQWFGVGEYITADTSSFVRRNTNTVGTATSITFTTSATTKYVVVSARNLAGATKVQLEVGNQTTSYALYYDYELCKIGTYQDYIYKSGEDWYVHKNTGKVTLDGSEYWYLANTNNYRYPFRVQPQNIKAASTQAETANIYCDNFYHDNSSEGDAQYATWFTCRTAQYPDTIWFFIPTAFFASTTSEGILAEYKTWLSTHHTTAWFILNNSTDTKITDSTLIGQLDAIHEWLTRYGYTATISGSLPLIINQANIT